MSSLESGTSVSSGDPSAAKLLQTIPQLLLIYSIPSSVSTSAVVSMVSARSTDSTQTLHNGSRAFSATSAGTGTLTVLSSAPCWNNARSPGVKRVQISSSVSGEVAITATRSSGVVYFAKSIDMSSSIKCAVENGQLRTR